MHTIKQFKIKNKCIFLIKKLQLIEHVYLFQEVEDDVRRNPLERNNIERLFSEYQSDPNKTTKYVPVKGVHHRRHTKVVAPLPSTRTQNVMSYMRVTNLQTRKSYKG